MPTNLAPGGSETNRRSPFLMAKSGGLHRVGEMVARLEQQRRPPLAEPEPTDDVEPVKRARRKYVTQLTSNKFLQSIFSLSGSKDKLKYSDSEDSSGKQRRRPREIARVEKSGSLKDAGRVIGLTTQFDGDPVVIRQNAFSKSMDLKRSKTEDSDSIFASLKPLFGFDKAQFLQNPIINPKKKKSSAQKAQTSNLPKILEPAIILTKPGIAIDTPQQQSKSDKSGSSESDLGRKSSSSSKGPKDKDAKGRDQRKSAEIKSATAVNEPLQKVTRRKAPPAEKLSERLPSGLSLKISTKFRERPTSATEDRTSGYVPDSFDSERPKSAVTPRISPNYLPPKQQPVTTTLSPIKSAKQHKSSPEIRISPPTDAKEPPTCDYGVTIHPQLPQYCGGLRVPELLPVDQYTLRPLDGPINPSSEPSLIRRRRSSGRMSGKPPLSRALTAIEGCSILPPLYESAEKSYEKEGDDSGVASSEAQPTDSSGTKNKRQMKRYEGASHTTSTYQGLKPTAADATERRHLIGFLHRTSHLSLTSELSGDASFYLIGHRGRRYEDSTMGSESDARMFSDEDDRGSTTTDLTSVSRQHENLTRRRRNRRHYRKPSRASSFSSITESSMSLDVITVTLNMDTVNFLGISIVGQTSIRGDSGIYVASIMKGGAVALDGRIEAGDMILQVNDIAFDNFTNDQAVDVLRDAVQRRGPIKLTVAKCFDAGPRNGFTIPRHQRDEPVRPIDTQAWIQHTNAMRGMPSIIEGSEGAATPIPDWQGHQRPASSSTVTSTGSNGHNTVIGSHIRLDLRTDKKKVVEVMAMPNSGLDIKDRTWLKIPIPMSFLGSDLVDWLLDHVEGLRERKDARKYAAELLRLKLIVHVVSKITFTEQCYYVLGDAVADAARYRSSDALGQHSQAGGVRYQPPHWPLSNNQQQQQQQMSDYASLPSHTPLPPHQPPIQQHQRSEFTNTATTHPSAIAHSDGGSSGGTGTGRSASGSGRGSGRESAQMQSVESAPSRQSFRMAMTQPYECYVDKI